MEVYVFECMYVLYAIDRCAQDESCGWLRQRPWTRFFLGFLNVTGGADAAPARAPHASPRCQDACLRRTPNEISAYSFTPKRAHPWLKSCSVENVPVGREVADGMKGRDGRRVGGASWSPNAQRAGLGVSTVPGLGGRHERTRWAASRRGFLESKRAAGRSGSFDSARTRGLGFWI